MSTYSSECETEGVCHEHACHFHREDPAAAAKRPGDARAGDRVDRHGAHHGRPAVLDHQQPDVPEPEHRDQGLYHHRAGGRSVLLVHRLVHGQLDRGKADDVDVPVRSDWRDSARHGAAGDDRPCSHHLHVAVESIRVSTCSSEF